MSYDVQMFVLCNHYVDEQFYDINKCPLCYGSGVYFDIYIDDAGKTVLAKSNLKLQQELLKISIEEKGSNVFHINWGNDVKRAILGSKNTNINRQKAEVIVRNTIEYLRSLQEGENLIYNHMSPDEIVASIESVDIVNVSQVSCEIRVVVRTKENNLVSFGYFVQ